jgi:hypothetical protein
MATDPNEVSITAGRFVLPETAVAPLQLRFTHVRDDGLLGAPAYLAEQPPVVETLADLRHLHLSAAAEESISTGQNA